LPTYPSQLQISTGPERIDQNEPSSSLVAVIVTYLEEFCLGHPSIAPQYYWPGGFQFADSDHL